MNNEGVGCAKEAREGGKADDGDDDGGVGGGMEGSRWSIGEGVEIWVGFAAADEVEDEVSPGEGGEAEA